MFVRVVLVSFSSSLSPSPSPWSLTVAFSTGPICLSPPSLFISLSDPLSSGTFAAKDENFQRNWEGERGTNMRLGSEREGKGEKG